MSGVEELVAGGLFVTGALGSWYYGRNLGNALLNKPHSEDPTQAPADQSGSAQQGAKDKLTTNSGDCGTGNCDDPNQKQSYNKKFTPEQTKGLRELFGQGPQGAQDLLDRLNSGQTVNLPQGVTPQTLEDYSQVAQQQINLGQDLNGVQQMRLQAIGKLLGK